jgi:hypothetical protein
MDELTLSSDAAVIFRRNMIYTGEKITHARKQTAIASRALAKLTLAAFPDHAGLRKYFTPPEEEDGS